MANELEFAISSIGGNEIHEASKRIEYALEIKRMSELIWAAAFALEYRKCLDDGSSFQTVEQFANLAVATYMLLRKTRATVGE